MQALQEGGRRLDGIGAARGGQLEHDEDQSEEPSGRAERGDEHLVDEEEAEAREEAQRVDACRARHVDAHPEPHESHHEGALDDAHRDGGCEGRDHRTQTGRGDDPARVERRAHDEVAHRTHPQGEAHEVGGESPSVACDFVCTVLLEVDGVGRRRGQVVALLVRVGGDLVAAVVQAGGQFSCAVVEVAQSGLQVTGAGPRVARSGGQPGRPVVQFRGPVGDRGDPVAQVCGRLGRRARRSGQLIRAVDQLSCAVGESVRAVAQDVAAVCQPVRSVPCVFDPVPQVAEPVRQRVEAGRGPFRRCGADE